MPEICRYLLTALVGPEPVRAPALGPFTAEAVAVRPPRSSLDHAVVQLVNDSEVKR